MAVSTFISVFPSPQSTSTPSSNLCIVFEYLLASSSLFLIIHHFIFLSGWRLLASITFISVSLNDSVWTNPDPYLHFFLPYSSSSSPCRPCELPFYFDAIKAYAFNDNFLSSISDRFHQTYNLFSIISRVFNCLISDIRLYEPCLLYCGYSQLLVHRRLTSLLLGFRILPLFAAHPPKPRLVAFLITCVCEVHTRSALLSICTQTNNRTCQKRQPSHRYF